MKVHEKNCINVKKFDKKFKAITKILMRKIILPKKDIKRNPMMKVED